MMRVWSPGRRLYGWEQEKHREATAEGEETETNSSRGFPRVRARIRLRTLKLSVGPMSCLHLAMAPSATSSKPTTGPEVM